MTNPETDRFNEDYPFNNPVDSRLDRIACHVFRHELFYVFIAGMLSGGLVSAITVWFVEKR